MKHDMFFPCSNCSYFLSLVTMRPHVLLFKLKTPTKLFFYIFLSIFINLILLEDYFCLISKRLFLWKVRSQFIDEFFG